MASLPLAFASILAGGVLVDKGWKDVKAGWGSQSSGGGIGGGAGVAGNSLVPSGSGGSGTHGLVTTALLAAIGKTHGWTGQQITDWMSLIQSESNGTLTDTNPSSGAYGIAQMLAPGGSPQNLQPNMEKYYQYGGNPNTVVGQLTAMANYIASNANFSNPSQAWAFHQANNYY